MPAGLQVWGPQGQIWLDTTQIPVRVTYSIAIGGTPGANADFVAPAGSTPWAFGYISNGRSAFINVSRSGPDTGHVEYFVTNGPGTFVLFCGYC